MFAKQHSNLNAVSTQKADCFSHVVSKLKLHNIYIY